MGGPFCFHSPEAPPAESWVMLDIRGTFRDAQIPLCGRSGALGGYIMFVTVFPMKSDRGLATLLVQGLYTLVAH